MATILGDTSPADIDLIDLANTWVVHDEDKATDISTRSNLYDIVDKAYPRLANDGSKTGATNLDLSKRAHRSITMTGNITLTFSNPAAGTVVRILFKQDSTGGRTVDWAGVNLTNLPPVIGTEAFESTLIELYFDGTYYLPLPGVKALGMGSIWHVRDNTLLNDYGDGANTPAEFGAALTSLLQGTGKTTLTAGDKVILGPGRIEIGAVVCAVSGITVEGQGASTVLEGVGASIIHIIEFTGNDVVVRNLKVEVGDTMASYNAGLEISGTDCVVEGCEVDGRHVANSNSPNTGAGNGILVNTGADRCLLRNNIVRNMRGESVLEGRGMYVLSNDTVVDGFYAEDNSYIGFRGSNCDNLVLSNVAIINSGKTHGGPGAAQNNARSIEIDGGLGPFDTITLTNILCLSTTPNGQAFIGWNTDRVTGIIDHARMDNVRIINRDNISPGVSYDIAARMQCCKFQSMRQLSLTNCTFSHGSNQNGGGTAYSFSWDGLVPKAHVTDCWFSGGVSGLQGDPFESMTYTRCTFGGDELTEASVNLIVAGKVKFDSCQINLGSSTAVAFSAATDATTSFDTLEVTNTTFTCDSASNRHICNDANLLSNVRRVIFDDSNTLLNNGAGTFTRSSTPNQHLYLSTMRNGDYAYDSLDSDMPAPGAGPTHFFTGVPGYLGQKIINIQWAGSGTQYWVYDGTGWRVGL
jgi:hypothetical protein